MAQRRQPGRASFDDVDKDTWADFSEELLSKDNFLFERQVEGGTSLVGPDWNSCLEYEVQLRKQPLKLVREEGRCGRLTETHSTEYVNGLNFSQSLTQRKNPKSLRLSSCSWRRSHNWNAVRSQPGRSQNLQTSPLQTLVAPHSHKKEIREKENLAKVIQPTRKGRRKVGPRTMEAKAKVLQSLLKQSSAVSGNRTSHNVPTRNKVCFKFQKNQCEDPSKCGRDHTCVGCGKPGVPHDNCRCLENSL